MASIVDEVMSALNNTLNKIPPVKAMGDYTKGFYGGAVDALSRDEAATPVEAAVDRNAPIVKNLASQNTSIGQQAREAIQRKEETGFASKAGKSIGNTIGTMIRHPAQIVPGIAEAATQAIASLPVYAASVPYGVGSGIATKLNGGTFAEGYTPAVEAFNDVQVLKPETEVGKAVMDNVMLPFQATEAAGSFMGGLVDDQKHPVLSATLNAGTETAGNIALTLAGMGRKKVKPQEAPGRTEPFNFKGRQQPIQEAEIVGQRKLLEPPGPEEVMSQPKSLPAPKLEQLDIPGPVVENANFGEKNGAQTATETRGISDPGTVRDGPEALAPDNRPQPGNGGSLQAEPLKGLPTEVDLGNGTKVTAAPHQPARDIAKAHVESMGMEYKPPTEFAKVDPERATRIAEEYAKMEHNPSDPETKAAYDALIDETGKQFDAMTKAGVKIEFIPEGAPDPYPNPRMATEDVRNNNHLYVFSTREGFGDATPNAESHPLLGDSGRMFGDQPALHNDVFRAVHDYFGHVKEGLGFRAEGEDNAYRSHAAMYSPKARRALATETRGQNSYVNYGPDGATNRTAKSGETSYAPQKVGLLPEWVSEEGIYDRLDTRKVEQDLKPVYEKAASIKPKYDELVNDVAQAVGGKAQLPKLKDIKRSAEKVRDKYDGDTTKLNDVLRSTIEVDSIDAAQKALSTLKEKAKVVSVDDRFANPTEGGYRDIQAIVDVDGIRSEVQINLPEMLTAKAEAHKLYEEARRAETSPARVVELFEQSKAIYDRAWNEATARSNSSLEQGRPLKSADAKENGRATGSKATAFVESPSPDTLTGMPSSKSNLSMPDSIADPAQGAKNSRYVTADEISDAKYKAFQEFRATPEWKRLTDIIEAHDKQSGKHHEQVQSEAVRMFKEQLEKTGNSDMLDDLPSSAISQIAMIGFGNKARELMGESPSEKSWRAEKDRTQAMMDYAKSKGIPEPREFADQANQDRAYYDTPEFKKWFNGSKAVNEAGKPLVAFHVTTKDFDKFDIQAGGQSDKFHTAYTGQIGSWFTAPSLQKGNYDPGNAEVAIEGFIEVNGESGVFKDGAQTMPVHLSIKNPMEYEGFEHLLEERDSFPTVAAYKADLIKQGHDGIVVRNSETDGNVDRDDWVAFEPTQIKSALGNSGKFDPKEPSVLGAKGQAAKVAEFYSGSDPVGRTEMLKSLRRLAEESYDEFTSPSEAYEALLEATKGRQRDVLKALDREDMLGYSYPHEAIEALLREPENHNINPSTKSALSKAGNVHFDLAPESAKTGTSHPVKLGTVPRELWSRNWVDDRMEPSLQPALESALGDVVAGGVPKATVDAVKGWTTHAKSSDMLAKYYPEDGIVSVRADIMEAAKAGDKDAQANVRWLVAHELSHAQDGISNDINKASSANSPLLAMDLSDSNAIVTDGPIMAEALQHYVDGGELASYLHYPFGDAALATKDEAFFQTELFAQLNALYTTDPAKLKRNLPEAYKTMEAIYGNDKQAGHTNLEVIDSVRKTLREESTSLDSPARLSRKALAERARDNAEESAGGGQGDRGLPARGRRPGNNVNWDVGDPTLWEKIRRAVQDKQIDTKVVQDAIEEGLGLKIPENADVYLADDNYYGRSAALVDNFRKDVVEPLVKAITKSDLTMQEVGNFLWARHAPERNRQMASINGGQQGLSGMSTKDARQMIADFQASGKFVQLNDVAKVIDKINADRVKMAVREGLLTMGEADAWSNAYKFYVPLMRDSDGVMGKGKGFSVRGPESQRAMGSKRAAVGILENVLGSYENTIIRAEKNRVAQTLLELVKQMPKSDFWQTDIVPVKKGIDPSTGQVTLYNDPSHKNLDNVVVVKVNGKEHTITFNSENERALAMAKAIKNLDVAQLGVVTKAIGHVTRFIGSMLTTNNPVFWTTNFVRDTQTAVVNLQGTILDGKAARVLKNIPQSLAGIWRAEATGSTSGWSQHYRDFEIAGGKTGFSQVFNDITDRQKALAKIMQRATRSAFDPRELAHATLDQIHHVNDAVENSIRLSAFVEAKRAGASDKKAAEVAKNVTVNFNRKGNEAWINSWYMFFNANLQGNARLAKAVIKSKKAQALVAGIVMLAFIQDIINRMIDEQGYDTLDNRMKAGNWIAMTGGGKYVTIPLPYGYNVFHNVGRTASEAFFKKDFDLGEAAATLGGTFADAFSPVGQAGSFSQWLSPTIFDVPIQIAENKTSFGSPMRPESKYDTYKPDYQKYWTSTPAPYVDAAKAFSDVTGGDDVRAGAVDVSPETLQAIFETVTGGVGKLATQSTDLAVRTATGRPIKTSGVPFVNRFAGEVDDKKISQKFFALREKTEKFDYEVKALRKDRQFAEATKLTKEHPELAAVSRVLASNKGQSKRLYADKKQLVTMPLTERMDAQDNIDSRQGDIAKRALAAYQEGLRGK